MTDALNSKFAKGNKILFSEGESSLSKAILRHENGSSAEIYCYGAHITSWKNIDSKELLFVSRKAVFAPGKAIRGGVPVIFPQFGPVGPLPSHGFARNQSWEVFKTGIGKDNEPFITFKLEATATSRAVWAKDFTFLYTVSLTDTLSIGLEIRNTGKEDFSFQVALHTYYAIEDITQTEVTGLTGLDFIDTAKNRIKGHEDRKSVTFDGEVDRVYLNTPTKLDIVEAQQSKRFVIEKENLPDAVIWNPGLEKSKSFSDLEPDEYRKFVCVEAGAIGVPVILKAGGSFSARQVVTAG